MSVGDAIVVLTTAGCHDEAATIAASLVDRRLAACVQVVPGVTSYYRWEGAVERSEEWLLVVKTTAERYNDVEHAIREGHSYAVPEVVRLTVDGGSAAYLDWLRQSVP